MRVLVVPAHQLQIGDILDEGQKLWMLSKDRETVTGFWAGEGGCLAVSPQDNAHKKVWHIDDPVRIIRTRFNEIN